MRLYLVTILALLVAPLCAQHVTVMEDETTFERTGQNTAVLTAHRVVRIEDEKGLDYANFVTTTSPNIKLTSFSGQVEDQQGKVVRKIKKGDLTISEISNGLADDYVRNYYVCDPIHYPFTVTYDYEERFSGGILNYPAFTPLEDYDVAVEHAVLRIVVDKGQNDVRFVEERMPIPVKKSMSEKGDKIVYTAEVNGLTPLKQSPYSLPLEKIVPMVKFAPTKFDWESSHCDLSSWSTFGQWIKEISADTRTMPEELKATVHRLTDGLPTAREKVHSLYSYLDKTTRYVSIQLGIGGYRPIQVEKTFKNSFGDCKGLSNYMVAMLKEAGLPADYVLISTRYDTLYKDMPNMNQLNHEIVRVPLPGDTLWLECTNAKYPIGYFPSNLAGHDAVVVDIESGKSSLERLPSIADSLNRQITEAEVFVEENGLTRFTIKQQSEYTQYEDKFSMQYWPENKKQDNFQHLVNIPGMKLETSEIRVDEFNPLLEWNLQCSSSSYLQRTGSRYFLPVSPLHLPASKITVPAEPYPFHVDYGFEDVDNIVINLPSTLKVEQLPQSVEFSNEMGSFSSVIEQKDNTIYVTHIRKVRHGYYPAELLKDWLDFRRKANAELVKKLVLVAN